MVNNGGYRLAKPRSSRNSRKLGSRKHALKKGVRSSTIKRLLKKGRATVGIILKDRKSHKKHVHKKHKGSKHRVHHAKKGRSPGRPKSRSPRRHHAKKGRSPARAKLAKRSLRRRSKRARSKAPKR